MNNRFSFAWHTSNIAKKRAGTKFLVQRRSFSSLGENKGLNTLIFANINFQGKRQTSNRSRIDTGRK